MSYFKIQLYPTGDTAILSRLDLLCIEPAALWQITPAIESEKPYIAAYAIKATMPNQVGAIVDWQLMLNPASQPLQEHRYLHFARIKSPFLLIPFVSFSVAREDEIKNFPHLNITKLSQVINRKENKGIA